MLTINILCVGKIKEKFFSDAILEYSKRLSKYCNLNIYEAQDSKVPDKVSDALAKQIKDEEAGRMLNCLNNLLEQ